MNETEFDRAAQREAIFDRMCLVALECASSDDAKRELTSLREWVRRQSSSRAQRSSVNHHAEEPSSGKPVQGLAAAIEDGQHGHTYGSTSGHP